MKSFPNIQMLLIGAVALALGAAAVPVALGIVELGHLRGSIAKIERAVSDVSFNPCSGFPSCAYFGDYTQLVSGPDGVIHAAWSDTRDGVSMQIWSQAVTW